MFKDNALYALYRLFQWLTTDFNSEGANFNSPVHIRCIVHHVRFAEVETRPRFVTRDQHNIARGIGQDRRGPGDYGGGRIRIARYDEVTARAGFGVA